VASRRTVDLDVDPAGLTEDAWDACDAVERLVASRLDGIVYVPGEGVYDERLQPILKTG
jgi:hypothetical protein